MRRPDPEILDGLDPQTRAAAEKAARRAGLSIEEWLASALERHAAQEHPAQEQFAQEQFAQEHRVQENSAGNFPAASADGEPPHQASRTAVALESMALWIEQAEERLDETERLSTEQHDRMTAVLDQALAALRERLDVVEGRVSATPVRAEIPVGDALETLTPVATSLVGLRSEMSRLVKRLEAPTFAAVAEIRDDIERLRSGLEGVATRNEIATLDETFRLLSRDLERSPSSKDLLTLAGSVASLQRQVQTLSDTLGEDTQRIIRTHIEKIETRIDAMAATGVDRSVIEFLSSQILDLRQDLAHRLAEPQQIERLSQDVAGLGRQLVELRTELVGRDDFTTLHSSLEGMCAALNRSIAAQEASTVPEHLQEMSRRLDLLVSRPTPEPADLDPIAAQLAVLTERMTEIVDRGLKEDDRLDALFGRLSSQVEAASEAASSLQEPLLQGFDRIEAEIRQIARQADASALAPMLESLHRKLEASDRGEALSGLEARIAALAEELPRIPHAIEGAAAQIAERAARAALKEVRPSGSDVVGELDALKARFAAMKALQIRAERRTQQTLQAVHDALETLIARFGAPEPAGTARRRKPSGRTDGQPSADRLEAAVRRLHAATLSQIEDVATALPGPKAGEEKADGRRSAAPHSVASFPLQDTDLGTVRASFIAAARRASQVAPPPPAEDKGHEAPPPAEMQVPLQPAAEEPPAEAPCSPPSLIERIRRSLEAHRRPFLLSVAVLLLGTGTMEVLANRPGAPPKPRAMPQVAAAVTAPTAPKAAAQPQPTIVATTNNSSLFQAASLGTPTAPAKFILDSATLPTIPDTVPAGLRQAALSGDAAAAYEIGRRLAEGLGLPEDSALAFRFLERAAEAGLAPAQERLAMMYDRGIGTVADGKLAVSWYRRAAQGGNVRAMHNLASLLASGAEGKPDYAGALQWFTEAAEAGVKDSQFNLGVIYARGIGARKDLSRAYRWFSLASAQGDPEAAKKRDEIAARLSPAETKAAKAAIDAWQPRATDPAANAVESIGVDRTADAGDAAGTHG